MKKFKTPAIAFDATGVIYRGIDPLPHAKEAFNKMGNAYLLNADLIEDKYYQFKGQR